LEHRVVVRPHLGRRAPAGEPVGAHQFERVRRVRERRVQHAGGVERGEERGQVRRRREVRHHDVAGDRRLEVDVGPRLGDRHRQGAGRVDEDHVALGDRQLLRRRRRHRSRHAEGDRHGRRRDHGSTRRRVTTISTAPVSSEASPAMTTSMLALPVAGRVPVGTGGRTPWAGGGTAGSVGTGSVPGVLTGMVAPGGAVVAGPTAVVGGAAGTVVVVGGARQSTSSALMRWQITTTSWLAAVASPVVMTLPFSSTASTAIASPARRALTVLPCWTFDWVTLPPVLAWARP